MLEPSDLLSRHQEKVAQLKRRNEQQRFSSKMVNLQEKEILANTILQQNLLSILFLTTLENYSSNSNLSVLETHRGVYISSRP